MQTFRRGRSSNGVLAHTSRPPSCTREDSGAELRAEIRGQNGSKSLPCSPFPFPERPQKHRFLQVGATGFEPATSTSRTHTSRCKLPQKTRVFRAKTSMYPLAFSLQYTAIDTIPTANSATTLQPVPQSCIGGGRLLRRVSFGSVGQPITWKRIALRRL
jgi:hypothetical protein